MRYEEITKERFYQFWNPGDDLFCVKVFKEPNQQCRLCDHTPITWNHVIYNRRTDASLIVGSVCVVQISKLMSDYSSDKRIYYPSLYKKAAEVVNSKLPQAVTVDDLPFKKAAEIVNSKYPKTIPRDDSPLISDDLPFVFGIPPFISGDDLMRDYLVGIEQCIENDSQEYNYDEEDLNIMMQELTLYQEHWARSEETGWFYDDGDDEPSENY